MEDKIGLGANSVLRLISCREDEDILGGVVWGGGNRVMRLDFNVPV